MISTVREWLHRVDSGPFASTHRGDGVAPLADLPARASVIRATELGEDPPTLPGASRGRSSSWAPSAAGIYSRFDPAGGAGRAQRNAFAHPGLRSLRCDWPVE
jgi:hypothetical protein